MNNLKNIHFLWIITVASTLSAILCLAYMFSENSNSSRISKLELKTEENVKKLNADLLDYNLKLSEFNSLRADINRLEKSVGQLSDSQKENTLVILARELNKRLTLLEVRIDSMNKSGEEKKPTPKTPPEPSKNDSDDANTPRIK